MNNLTSNQSTRFLVRLPNSPGALLNFLEPFANAGVNILSIFSQVVHGKPGTYDFVIEVEQFTQELKHG